MRFSAALLLAPLLGCQGVIGDPGDGPDPPVPNRDAGPRPPGEDAGPPPPPAECGVAGEAIVYFEGTCAANGACHQPGGQFPDLTRAGLATLAELTSEASGESMLIPGSPEDSWLYKKMAGLQGDPMRFGGVMPAGRDSGWDELPEDVAFVRDWIEGGAPAVCDELPPSDVPLDPNTLDREALFSCDDPSATRSSPARYRRIERLELTHAVGRRIDGNGSSVIDNPLVAPPRHPYSTYADGVTLDAPTLGVLTLSMPEASQLWTREELSSDVLNSSELSCFYSDETPDDACIDRFVDTLLRHGALFRSPTAYETTHLRSLVVRTLARESGVEDRRGTIRVVFQAAMLSAGGMFRAELPRTASDTRMTGEAVALALARVLSTRPVGALKLSSFEGLAADPDMGNHEAGWFAAVADAAAIPAGEAGSIFDPEVRRELVLRYAGGVDPSRAFWNNEESGLLAAGNPPSPGRLGEFWITGEMVRFFREWLDYTEADTILKEDPDATSRYDDDDTFRDANRGYDALQGGGSREGRLTHQLDDWIARLVVETHDDSTRDFWRELMTGRTWHVPATGRGPDCETGDDCTMTYASCTRFGDCRNTSGSVRRMHTDIALSFSVESQVYGGQTDRWVEVPEAERRGVLTHPTWLTAHGGNFEDDASLVHRGKWVREAIFCETIPPLSLVEVDAQLVPSRDDLTARNRVAESTTDPQCITCHQLMNPLGNLFELYNHAGFFRHDDHGTEPDGSSTLTNLPTAFGEDLNADYATPFDFVEALARSRLARQGLVRHAFRYFMGRDETLADACTLTEMEQALDARGSFVDMVAALVATDTFVRRHLEEDAE